MTPVFIFDDQADRFQRICPVIILHVFERKHDNRISSLEFPVFLPAVPYFLIRKILRCILLRLFKEGLDHINSQGLAEAAGSGEQSDHVVVIDQIPDQKGFINVIAFTGDFYVGCVADGAGKKTFVRGVFIFSKDNACFLHIVPQGADRDLPAFPGTECPGEFPFIAKTCDSASGHPKPLGCLCSPYILFHAFLVHLHSSCRKSL